VELFDNMGCASSQNIKDADTLSSRSLESFSYEQPMRGRVETGSSLRFNFTHGHTGFKFRAIPGADRIMVKSNKNKDMCRIIGDLKSSNTAVIQTLEYNTVLELHREGQDFSVRNPKDQEATAHIVGKGSRFEMHFGEKPIRKADVSPDFVLVGDVVKGRGIVMDCNNDRVATQLESDCVEYDISEDIEVAFILSLVFAAFFSQREASI